MVLKLYMNPFSPPSRAVLWTASLMNLDIEEKLIFFNKDDQKKPEFLKMNPQHTVPTLNDNGFIIWESAAICEYLVDVYGTDDSLYPKDPKKRALISQRLHFNSSILFANLRENFFSVILERSVNFDKKYFNIVKECLEFLEEFLRGFEWLAGDSVTIADICSIPTVLCMKELVPINEKSFPNINKWMKNCATLPGFEEKVLFRHKELAASFKELYKP